MLISITVLAMEGSGSMQMIVPLMVAVTMAKIVGDALTLPIYDMQIKIRGAPVLVSGSSCRFLPCCTAMYDRRKCLRRSRLCISSMSLRFKQLHVL